MLLPVESAGDCAEVAGLADRIWREHYTPIIGKAQVDYMLKKFQSASAIEDQINNQNYQYFILKKDSRTAGYLAVRIDGDTLFLSKIYVDSLLRGKGYGREMMNFLEDFCRNAGLREIWLTVNKNNTKSIETYKRMGFVNTGTVCTDIGGGFVMDDYKMVKSLRNGIFLY
jgi:ribosomal protein S18 acetylase RimI-like enzyme